MSSEDNTARTAADCRRATALVCHYAVRDVDGCNEVFAEATEASRVTQMIVALLDQFQNIVPALVTKLGMVCLSEHVLIMTEDADGDPDVRAAAGLIAHHANDNTEAYIAVLSDADEDDRVTELVLAVLNLYETLLPALYAPTGLQALQQTVVDFAVQENAS